MAKKLSRRDFLRLGATASAAGLLAGCFTPEPTEAPATAVPPTDTPEPTATLKPGEPTPTPVPPTPTPTPVPPLTVVQDKYPNGWTTEYTPPPYTLPETMEFSIPFAEPRANQQYQEGDEDLDRADYRFITEVSNLQVVPKFRYSTDYDTKMLAAMFDQDLPDAFQLSPKLYGRFLQAGALEDITEIYESTASDQLKEYLNKYEGRIIRTSLVNGRMMGMPGGAKFEGQDNMLLYYREDLLDELGLAPPETIDEFEEILRASKDAYGNDPSWVNLPGNRVLITWINSFDSFFGPTGAIPSNGRTDLRVWVKGDDDKLVYGSVDPRIRPVLQMLQDWYTDGLIDPEFFTRDESKSTEPVGAGKCVMFFGPAWAIGWPAGQTASNVEGASWGFTLPPKGANGQRGWLETNPTYGYLIGFRKGIDPRLVEAYIEYENWALENIINWYDRNIYGHEVYQWTYDEETGEYNVSNRPSGNIPAFPSLQSRHYYLSDVFEFFGIGRELGGGSMDGLNGAQLNIASKASPDLGATGEALTQPAVEEGVTQGVYTEFFGPPTGTMAERGAQLDKLEQETFTSVITGDKTLEDYDAFVEAWYKNGGDLITREVNIWYETGESF